MKLELFRDQVGDECTEGELTIGGELECYTLEDVVRPHGVKVHGKTAIPAGTYRIIVTHSPHFGRDLPLLLDVPMFEGVRIHPGNTAADTEGCILVGRSRMPGMVQQSRVAFDTLFPKIQAALQGGEEVWINIQ